MEYPISYQSGFDLINSHLHPLPPLAAHPMNLPEWRAVTFSRQTGCGAHVIAEKLAQILQDHARAAVHWKVYDRNLMETVLAEHNLPVRLAKFLPEDRAGRVQDIVDELAGMRPNAETIAIQTGETILNLVKQGHVIVIGRGANVITAKLSGVFHVRLVAPLPQRIEYAREFYNLTRKDAAAFCLREDLGRKRYLKKYFGANIEDPLLSHLTINTGLMSFEAAAQLIARTMHERHQPMPARSLPAAIPLFPTTAVRAYG